MNAKLTKGAIEVLRNINAYSDKNIMEILGLSEEQFQQYLLEIEAEELEGFN